MRKIYQLLLLLCSLLVVSCIDGEEEFWLNRDGSGRAVITYTVPSSFVALRGGEEKLRTTIQEKLGNRTEVALEKVEVTTDDGRTRVYVAGSFPDAMKLVDLAHDANAKPMPAALEALLGKFDVRLKGRDVSLLRTMEPAKLLGGGLFKPSARDLEGHRLKYTLHLPVAAHETNATSTADGGQTLMWDIPLEKAVDQPVTLSFHARMPIPLWIWLTGAAVILAVVFLVWRKLRSSTLASKSEREDFSI